MNKNNIQIKQIQLSDFSEILSLWKKAGLAIQDDRQEYLEFQNILRLNSLSCLVLVKNQTIIGSILGTFNGRRGWIYHLAIDPLFQHQGWGSLLLEQAEYLLKKQGASRVCLGILHTNLKVIPFYEKCGYKIINDTLWLGKDI